MEKTLVYHLYVKDDFYTNIAYAVHLYCLRKYKDVFNKVKITVSIDDLSRQDLLGGAYNWINSIGFNCETQINVIKNGELGESDTFKREILDMANDGMVFFAHSKGVGKVYDGKINSSVLIWIILLYYENLNDVKYVENKFLDMPLKQTIFHGTLLIGSEKNQPLINAFGKHFSGNFFWINMPKYKNWRQIGKIPEMYPDGRWFVETYPNMVCSFEMMGGGMDTKDSIWFEMETVQTYEMTLDDWDFIFNAYGNKDNMLQFLNDIYDNIGIDSVDFTNKF